MTSRIPTDSADVAEQRERAAARANVDQHAAAPHDARCVGGWLGHDYDGRPVPCLRCRAHLLAHPCVTCGVREQRCRKQLEQLGTRCCTDCRHGHGPTAPGSTERESA